MQTMSITLTLAPEQQALLEQQAAAAGIDVTRFILDAVRERLEEQNGHPANEMTYEQWINDFRAWIARQKSRNPQFDDSRDSIYN